MADYVETFGGKLDWALPFQRTNAFPLDRSSMFSSYADAVKYAAGKASDPDSRGLQGTSYVGQIVTVFNGDAVTLYKITADRHLDEIGRLTQGDNKSVSLNDTTLSLYGFSGATAGQQVRVKNFAAEGQPADLRLEWFTPDTSDITDLQDRVATLEGDEDTDGSVDYKIKEFYTGTIQENYYDKTTVDGKLTGALHYKGAYNTFALLLAHFAESGVTAPSQGDVYNIRQAGGVDSDGVAIKAGDNVIFNGEGDGTTAASWDVSSGTTDLSDYYTKTEVDTIANTKVDKVAGEGLLPTTERTRLEGLEAISDATSGDGIITLTNKAGATRDITVYSLPVAGSDLGGIKSTASSTDNTNKVTVAADGSASVDHVAANSIVGIVAEAAKTTHKITIGTKQFDGSADITILASDIPVPNTYVQFSDIATGEKTGVVKSSADQDKVSVNASSGEMTVNNISASKVQGSVASAEKVDHTITIGEKSFDGSANVTILAEDIPVPNTYVQFTDIATGEKTGVVKSSSAKDYVSVTAAGLMAINTVSGSKIDGAVAEATNATKLGNVAATDILVASGADLTSKVKTAAKADQLDTARTISMTGDGTWSVTFDGSDNVTSTMTLANSGVTAGTYTKVTVDAKGRVTAGATLDATDIPTLTLAKISDAGTLAGKNEVARSDIASTFEADIAALETASHTHANKSTLDDISSEDVTHLRSMWTKHTDWAEWGTTLADYGITDAYTKTQIDEKIGGAFHYKGSKNTFTELTTDVTDPDVGDVWNIATAGGTDSKGVAIKAGDNVACSKKADAELGTPAEWDVLAGTTDLSDYKTWVLTKAEIDKKADQTDLDAVDTRLQTVETVVGASDSDGLRKKVADLETSVGTSDASGLRKDMIDVKANLGTASVSGGAAATGLHADVEKNTADIATLNGDDQTEGSVRQLIAASASDIQDALDEITEASTGTIDTRIAAHNTAADAHSALFAAKQNKVFQATVTLAAASFAASASGAPAAYTGEFSVTGLDSSKNYTLDVVPQITAAQVSTFLAAGFMPQVICNNGKLYVYAQHQPDADFVVTVTATEIQA